MKDSHEMKKRLVRRSEMISCKSAFIDAYTPGSHLKDNYSIIGPGVTENRDQFVNINEPHGFNIGAAGQPPSIKNSLHSHFTAEVFMVHEGMFKIFWGLDGQNKITLYEGDVVSIPTHCFRGFENIGKKYGFLYTVLGGDNTGGVEWAPQVFKEAEDHGLVLLEDLGVWDLNKNPMPKEAKKVEPMSYEKATNFDNYSIDQMEQRIYRSGSFQPLRNHPLKYGALGNIDIHRIIGMEEAKIPGGDGFELLLSKANPGGGFKSFSRPEKEVLICYKGAWKVDWNGNRNKGSFLLNAGDLFSIPSQYLRSIKCIGEKDGFLYSVINKNCPTIPKWN